MFTGTDKNLLLTTARYLDQKEYWLKKIFADPDGLPGTRLLSGNMKRSRNIPPPARYEKVAIPIPADLYTALMKLSRNTDLSLYLVLLATLESLIYHYTGSEDMLVISPLYKPNISAGTLNNFLFIRQEHTGHLTCKELLIATRQTVFEAYENQDYPFDHLLDLFFKSGQVPDAYLPGLCSHVECRLENIHAYENEEHTEIKDRLVFSFLHEEDRVSGHILYHSFIYDEFYVQQAAKHFVSILAVILANIDIKIMDISFLSEAEQEQLIHIFNKTETYYVDDKSLCERFAEQVSRRPGGTALVFEDCHVTYRLLDQDSDYLAFLLQKKGIINGDIVGLTGRRSLEMVVSIWGILKAGAAYLPIDPEYPKDRIDYMLKDSNAAILLTDIEKKTDNCQCSIVNCQLSMGESRASFYHSNLAYVIYTSGSTGKPKGVMVEQRSVINLIDWFGKVYQLGINTIVLQLTHYHFDPSVEDIFGTLLYGGTLHTANEDLLNDPWRFKQYVEKRQVHLINYIPTYLKTLIADEDGGRLGSLRVIISGGEPLDETLKDRLLEKGYRLYNNYGPTELTTDALSSECSLTDPVTLGKPVANCRAYILDKHGRLLPIGVSGELYISGAGVARGYLNNPELTAEKFYRSYWSYGTYILYQTGDLARWLPTGPPAGGGSGGVIEFLGRSDRQVKIRGYRVELGEIEKKLLEHPDIKDVIVTYHAENTYTCAYFVSDRVDREWSQAEIREYMGQELPDYMIPSYFMKIEGIPLDANGKINRKALPDPRITLAEEYEAPRDIIEEKLVTLWSEVLSPGNVFPGFPASIGINADFFHLGGHSLKATILAAKIHKVYNIKLPLTQIFKTPTIKGLAEFIKAISTVPAKDKDRYAGIELAEKKQYYPLSSAQKRMYILQQMEPTANAYNIPGIFQLQGLLDMDRLNSTFAALIQRHESLRTSFQMHMGKPVQRIQRQMPFEIAYFKASPLNDNVNAIIKEFNSYFDLSKAPLFRAGLIHWDAGTADKYILMIIIHHIIADGISADILAADFIALYAGKELPEIKFQYKDYSEWQNKEDWYKNIRRQKEYWRKQFENGIPVLNFPNDYERPAIHSFAGETLNVVLGKRESGVLNKLALAEGATMYMVLLSIFYILLFKITRQEDIVVGTPAAGRGHADLLNVAGVFVNTLALLNFPAPEKTFSAFLQEVKERTLSAFENQDYPFEDLAADLAGARHGQRNSFFDVMFDFQVSKRKEEITGEIIDGLSIKPLPLAMETGTSKFDFNLITCETGERIALLLEYSTSLYKKETMAMLLKHYGQIVHCVVKNVVEKVDIKIRDIELIDQNESDRIRSKILKDIEAIETVKNVDFDI